jgi:O-antigen/teichoic acid export membrane protein
MSPGRHPLTGGIATWSKRVIIVTLGSAAAQILGFVFLLLLTRFYTLEEYGVIRYVLGVGMFAGNLAAVGIGGGLTRLLASGGSDAKGRDEAYSNVMALGGALTLATSVVLLALYRDVLFGVIAVGVSLTVLYHGALAGLMMFERLAAFSFAANALRILVFLSLIFLSGAGGTAVPLLLHAGAALLAIAIFSVAGPLPLRLRREMVTLVRMRRMLRFAGLLMVASVSISATLVVNLVLLEAWKGYAELATFSVAYTLAVPITLIAQGMGNVLFPKVAEASDAARRWRMLRLAMAYTVGLSLPLVPVYHLAGPAAVSLFLGDGYRQASGPLSVLAFAYLLMNIRWILAAYFEGAGKAGISAASAVVCAIVTASFAWLLIPATGATGAAWAVAAGFAASVAVCAAGLALPKGPGEGAVDEGAVSANMGRSARPSIEPGVQDG